MCTIRAKVDKKFRGIFASFLLDFMLQLHIISGHNIDIESFKLVQILIFLCLCCLGCQFTSIQVHLDNKLHGT